jgi:hypothetical protein
MVLEPSIWMNGDAEISAVIPSKIAERVTISFVMALLL